MVFWCFQGLEKGSIGSNWVNGHKSFCVPIFCHNKLISDFREKAELFNSFLANQCSLITNTCELPTNCKSSTDKSLSNISFTDNDIGKIIKGFRSQQSSWSWYHEYTHAKTLRLIFIFFILIFLRSGDFPSIPEKR